MLSRWQEVSSDLTLARCWAHVRRRVAGLSSVKGLALDVTNGRIRASAGVAASLPPEPVAAFDQALAALLAEHFPDQPLQVPHRLFALLATAPR